MDEKKTQKELKALVDPDYRLFELPLIPNVDPKHILGIRSPVFKKYAKDFVKRSDALEYLKYLPHYYIEENNLHLAVISSLSDYDQVIKRLDEFLPYVDNWATCDSRPPKVFAKNLSRLRKDCYRWIKSKDVYSIRFGIGNLMRYYLDAEFSTDDFTKILKITNEDYYVKMMIAWYFATALAKQYPQAVKVIENKQLPVLSSGFNTFFQKVQSYRLKKEIVLTHTRFLMPNIPLLSRL